MAWLASEAGLGEESVVFVKHGKISASGSQPLLVIHASSDGLDSRGDFGNGFPFADVLTPIVLDSFEAVGNVF